MKKKYYKPFIEVLNLEIEQSVAASSVTITPGGGNYQPSIEEEEEEKDEIIWDF